jgi:hypothetical protein
MTHDPSTPMRGPESPGERDGDQDHVDAILGSVPFATTMERRRFLRKIGNSLFYGAAAVATGRGFKFLLSNPVGPDAAQGPCCPVGCGPSPCCATSCCDKNCCQTGKGSDTCVNNGSTCLGKTYGDYHTTGCWTYVYTKTLGTAVTCCDCKTNNTSGCTNSINRCICYHQYRLAPTGLSPDIRAGQRYSGVLA